MRVPTSSSWLVSTLFGVLLPSRSTTHAFSPTGRVVVAGYSFKHSFAAKSTGQDYCGYQALYKIRTGELQQPLPTHYIPPALLEWGQEPYYVETITSEDHCNEESSPTWTRHTLTVLPETGCAIDNLQVLHHTQEFHTQEVHSPNIRTIQRQNDPTTVFLETSFLLPAQHRLRMSLECRVVTTNHNGAASFDIQDSSVVQVTWERQFDSSSQGQRAKAGGLDAQSLSRWKGDQIRDFTRDKTTVLQNTTFLPCQLELSCTPDTILMSRSTEKVSFQLTVNQDNEMVVQVVELLKS